MLPVAFRLSSAPHPHRIVSTAPTSSIVPLRNANATMLLASAAKNARPVPGGVRWLEESALYRPFRLVLG